MWVSAGRVQGAPRARTPTGPRGQRRRWQKRGGGRTHRSCASATVRLRLRERPHNCPGPGQVCSGTGSTTPVPCGGRCGSRPDPACPAPPRPRAGSVYPSDAGSTGSSWGRGKNPPERPPCQRLAGATQHPTDQQTVGGPKEGPSLDTLPLLPWIPVCFPNLKGLEAIGLGRGGPNPWPSVRSRVEVALALAPTH